MGILGSFVMGVVEGVTEFLPISSTGHLILVSALLGVIGNDFVKTFEVVIQLGAILAVVILYWRSFLNWQLLTKVAVAFVPTGIIGLALYSLVKTYLLGNEIVVLAALALGGAALIAFEKYVGERPGAGDLTTLSYKDAALIGLAQAVAIIPGVSRSAATVLGGLSLGLSRAATIEFSFLLATPTMLAASGLSLVKGAAWTYSSGEWLLLIIGFFTAFVVALAAVRWLLGYVRRNDFTAFGWYRIAIAAIFALWLIL